MNVDKNENSTWKYFVIEKMKKINQYSCFEIYHVGLITGTPFFYHRQSDNFSEQGGRRWWSFFNETRVTYLSTNISVFGYFPNKV